MRLITAFINVFYIGCIVIYTFANFNIEWWKSAYYIWDKVARILLLTCLIYVKENKKDKICKRILLITGGFMVMLLAWDLASIMDYKSILCSKGMKLFITVILYGVVFYLTYSPYLDKYVLGGINHLKKRLKK